MNKRNNSGFTLVELTLAIAFLSILLMAILSLTLTAGKLYIKGETNRNINQSGRDFSDIIRRDMLSSSMGQITPVITVNGGSPTAYSGRICLGTVSYLWNSAGLINWSSALATSVRVTMGTSNSVIKFVRIDNPSQDYCTPNALGQYIHSIPITERATDLFGGTGREYAIYKINIRALSRSGSKGLYLIKYTLGTNDESTTQTDIVGGYTKCIANGDTLTADFNYCSVQDFEMITRVGGIE